MAKHTPNPHSKQDMNPAQDMTFERDMTPAAQESASARMPPRRGFLKSALVGATAIAGVALDRIRQCRDDPHRRIRQRRRRSKGLSRKRPHPPLLPPRAGNLTTGEKR